MGGRYQVLVSNLEWTGHPDQLLYSCEVPAIEGETDRADVQVPFLGNEFLRVLRSEGLPPVYGS